MSRRGRLLSIQPFWGLGFKRDLVGGRFDRQGYVHNSFNTNTPKGGRKGGPWTTPAIVFRQLSVLRMAVVSNQESWIKRGETNTPKRLHKRAELPLPEGELESVKVSSLGLVLGRDDTKFVTAEL